MTDDQLDLVPTEDLWNAIERRTTAAVLVTQREVNAHPDLDERGVSFHGGMAAAFGLLVIAEKVLDDRWRGISERYPEEDDHG